MLELFMIAASLRTELCHSITSVPSDFQQTVIYHVPSLVVSLHIISVVLVYITFACFCGSSKLFQTYRPDAAYFFVTLVYSEENSTQISLLISC